MLIRALIHSVPECCLLSASLESGNGQTPTSISVSERSLVVSNYSVPRTSLHAERSPITPLASVAVSTREIPPAPFEHHRSDRGKCCRRPECLAEESDE
jgi:hypothetical protein